MKSPSVVIFLRADPALKAALERCAAENGRTLNSEAVRRLRASLEGYSQTLRR